MLFLELQFQLLDVQSGNETIFINTATYNLFLDFYPSKFLASFKLIPEVSLCLSFIVEISSDGASPLPSSYNNLEAEFREMKLHLLMEIQKRTQVEESLQNLQNLWQRLSHQLSLLGFSLPLPPSITEDMNTEHSVDPVVELSQQIFVARFVADAVGRGSARAEVEMEMEPQIASKNFEITRLWDRLQYYEAANREMSHRNQEAVEMARQQRNRRKRRQKWFWGSICLAITITGAAIAWSYLPSTEAIPSESKSATSGEQE